MKFVNPDIQFEVEGRAKPLTLRMGVKALACLQDHWQLPDLGEVLRKIASLDEGAFTEDDLNAIMWAGLRSHQPDLSFDEASDIMDIVGPIGLTALLARGMSAAMPQEGGGDASENPRKAKRGR